MSTWRKASTLNELHGADGAQEEDRGNLALVT